MILAFYRSLLRLYPRAFQEQYGREMTVAFRDRWAHEGGLGLLLSTTYDTVTTAVGVHTGMLGQDLRYGFRALRKDRSFSIAAIATLALGIGATTAMFSVAYAVLLRPLPFAESERLVRVHDTNPALRIAAFANSVPNLIDWQKRTKAFASLAGFRSFDLTVTEGSGAERVEGLAVIGPFWETIGQKMVLGRPFLPEEATEGNDKVVILGEAFWERRFARDPGVIGRSISVGGVGRLIVGIAPSDLGMGTAIDIFGPFSEGQAANSRGDRQIRVLGRLRTGVGMAQANQELDGIAAQLEREYPRANEGWRTQLMPIRDWVLEPQMQRAMYVLLGAAGLLLAIACVNVANLLVARSAVREREFGARLALGASKSRLARQLVTESLLLGHLGGAAGVALAWVFIRMLTPLLPVFISRVELNWQVLCFAFFATIAVSLLFGIGPALAGARGDIRSVLQASTRGESAAHSGSRSLMRQALVASQVALATILLIGALLLTVSFTRIVQQDFGFRSDHLLTARFSPAPGRFNGGSKWSQYIEAILAEMRSLPGVKSAAMTNEIPFGPFDTQ
jgi:putative ABC transport system permease protein